jgi:hypothetical protein
MDVGALLKNPKGKRNKAIIAVLLPAIIFLWIVGWSLYWIGRQKEAQKPQSSLSCFTFVEKFQGAFKKRKKIGIINFAKLI